MPMYEYHCKTCDETIEVLLRHGEPEPRQCGEDCARDFGPQMGLGEVTRQMSLTGGYQLGGSREYAAKSASACGHCGEVTDDPCA